MERYAHTHPQHPDDPACWEPLEGEQGHLQQVSLRCRAFAARALRGLPALIPVAERCARWHDLGKFSDAFQHYLRQAGADSHVGERSGRVDHSTAGAQHAMRVLPPPLNAMVAYCIAGHHAGLLDGRRAEGASLCARLDKDDLPAWRDRVPARLLETDPVDPRQVMQNFTPGTADEVAFQLGFATRMLFSCLVDADFLATEAFMNPVQAADRAAGKADFADLARHLDRHIEQRFGGVRGAVADARARVLAACRDKAQGKPGLYSLSVPTGGGKTLSSLAFALHHCAAHGLDRVIYAIPFTSIIEQTADVFRGIFEDYPQPIDRLILEHHSNFDPEKETVRTRLASENWDAPIVVTTNVQLFESLFASKTSRCRKLHRIANSVIILDEAQTLPLTLLKPCLKALELLVGQYGCTIVLCTATQPAIERRDDFVIGLPAPTSIIDDAPRLYRDLKRVEVRDAGRVDCDELARLMAESSQGLAIVNTRAHAAELYQVLKETAGAEGCYHLSAAMTPEHRSAMLADICQRLKGGQPCRVVATPLIEAGVDVDFPVVWRALAGLDSIAQAAGRCNREGRLRDAITWIFEPAEDEYARLFGTLRTGRDAASQIIQLGCYQDLLGLDAIEHYFRLHYWSQQDQWDKAAICSGYRIGQSAPYLSCDFARIAQAFRFIEEGQRPIVVGWDAQAERLINQLRDCHDRGLAPDRRLTRRLQRISVSVSRRLWQKALGEQTALLCDRYAVLLEPRLHYSLATGLQLDADPLYDPNLLITD